MDSIKALELVLEAAWYTFAHGHATDELLEALRAVTKLKADLVADVHEQNYTLASK